MGGLRNQWYEGPRQRRPESFRVGWLVGGRQYPRIGWVIGDGQEHGEDPDGRQRSGQFVSLLEAEVIPEFYERNKSGMPDKWLGRIRESMASLLPNSPQRAPSGNTLRAIIFLRRRAITIVQRTMVRSALACCNGTGP